MITKKDDGRFEVRSGDGKKLLGTHENHGAALRQLAAIEAGKRGRRTGGKD